MVRFPAASLFGILDLGGLVVFNRRLGRVADGEPKPRARVRVNGHDPDATVVERAAELSDELAQAVVGLGEDVRPFRGAHDLDRPRLADGT